MSRKLLPCLECSHVEGAFVTGREVYPHRPDLYGKRFYRCTCGAFVGCHADSGLPLGRPAGQATKTARRAAHAAFDPLWQRQNRFGSRGGAYRWLADQLGMDRKHCHIGEMDRSTAQRVVEAISALAASTPPQPIVSRTTTEGGDND